MERDVIEIVGIDSLVPKEHLLRQIDDAVDFNKLYEIVEELYCEDNGRPSIDPVVLFKMVLIQHLYGLPSLRRTAEEVSLNVAYRWFLGYSLQEETPHFSTVSYNFRHRFTTATVERVFAWILDEIAEAGYLSPKAVFIDGTHIKASANTKKKVKEKIPAASKHYAKELMEEVNKDREAHGKKPFDDDSKPTTPTKRNNTSKKKLARRKKEKTRTVTRSVTDPACGMFVKGDHKRQFAYEAHTACDKHGFVLEAVVTPGNVHDSVAFDDVYDKVTESFPEVKTIVADAAYKTPHICKKVFEDKRILSTAYKRPQTMKGGHEWWKYVYDEYYDCIICPEYQILHYSTTNRDGYREYKSDPKICAQCPTRELCTRSKDCVKTVQRHIWKDYEELADDARYTPKYRDLYKRRKETIERVFADAKEKHAMRYTQYRGLAQVANWVKLKFVAMNLKKFAKWKWKEAYNLLHFLLAYFLDARNPVYRSTVGRVSRQTETRCRSISTPCFYFLYLFNMPDILCILCNGSVRRELAAVANIHPAFLGKNQLIFIISCHLLLCLQITLKVQQQEILVGTMPAGTIHNRIMQLTEDTRTAIIQCTIYQRIEHTLDFIVIVVHTIWIIMLLYRLDFLHGCTKDIFIDAACFLNDFDVGTIQRAERHCTICHQLHVTRAGSLLASRGNLFRYISGCDDFLRIGYIIVCKECNLDFTTHTLISVNEVCHLVNEFDDALCTRIARC